MAGISGTEVMYKRESKLGVTTVSLRSRRYKFPEMNLPGQPGVLVPAGQGVNQEGMCVMLDVGLFCPYCAGNVSAQLSGRHTRVAVSRATQSNDGNALEGPEPRLAIQNSQSVSTQTQTAPLNPTTVTDTFDSRTARSVSSQDSDGSLAQESFIQVKFGGQHQGGRRKHRQKHGAQHHQRWPQQLDYQVSCPPDQPQSLATEASSVRSERLHSVDSTATTTSDYHSSRDPSSPVYSPGVTELITHRPVEAQNHSNHSVPDAQDTFDGQSFSSYTNTVTGGSIPPPVTMETETEEELLLKQLAASEFPVAQDSLQADLDEDQLIELLSEDEMQLEKIPEQQKNAVVSQPETIAEEQSFTTENSIEPANEYAPHNEELEQFYIQSKAEMEMYQRSLGILEKAKCDEMSSERSASPEAVLDQVLENLEDYEIFAGDVTLPRVFAVKGDRSGKSTGSRKRLRMQKLLMKENNIEQERMDYVSSEIIQHGEAISNIVDTVPQNMPLTKLRQKVPPEPTPEDLFEETLESLTDLEEEFPADWTSDYESETRDQSLTILEIDTNLKSMDDIAHEQERKEEELEMGITNTTSSCECLVGDRVVEFGSSLDRFPSSQDSEASYDLSQEEYGSSSECLVSDQVKEEEVGEACDFAKLVFDPGTGTTTKNREEEEDFTELIHDTKVLTKNIISTFPNIDGERKSPCRAQDMELSSQPPIEVPSFSVDQLTSQDILKAPPDEYKFEAHDSRRIRATDPAAQEILNVEEKLELSYDELAPYSDRAAIVPTVTIQAADDEDDLSSSEISSLTDGLDSSLENLLDVNKRCASTSDLDEPYSTEINFQDNLVDSRHEVTDSQDVGADIIETDFERCLHTHTHEVDELIPQTDMECNALVDQALEAAQYMATLMEGSQLHRPEEKVMEKTTREQQSFSNIIQDNNWTDLVSESDTKVANFETKETYTKEQAQDFIKQVLTHPDQAHSTELEPHQDDLRACLEDVCQSCEHKPKDEKEIVTHDEVTTQEVTFVFKWPKKKKKGNELVPSSISLPKEIVMNTELPPSEPFRQVHLHRVTRISDFDVQVIEGPSLEMLERGKDGEMKRVTYEKRKAITQEGQDMSEKVKEGTPDTSVARQEELRKSPAEPQQQVPETSDLEKPIDRFVYEGTGSVRMTAMCDRHGVHSVTRAKMCFNRLEQHQHNNEFTLNVDDNDLTNYTVDSDMSGDCYSSQADRDSSRDTCNSSGTVVCNREFDISKSKMKVDKSEMQAVKKCDVYCNSVTCHDVGEALHVVDELCKQINSNVSGCHTGTVDNSTGLSVCWQHNHANVVPYSSESCYDHIENGHVCCIEMSEEVDVSGGIHKVASLDCGSESGYSGDESDGLMDEGSDIQGRGSCECIAKACDDSGYRNDQCGDSAWVCGDDGEEHDDGDDDGHSNYSGGNNGSGEDSNGSDDGTHGSGQDENDANNDGDDGDANGKDNADNRKSNCIEDEDEEENEEEENEEEEEDRDEEPLQQSSCPAGTFDLQKSTQPAIINLNKAVFNDSTSHDESANSDVSLLETSCRGTATESIGESRKKLLVSSSHSTEEALLLEPLASTSASCMHSVEVECDPIWHGDDDGYTSLQSSTISCVSAQDLVVEYSHNGAMIESNAELVVCRTADTYIAELVNSGVFTEDIVNCGADEWGTTAENDTQADVTIVRSHQYQRVLAIAVEKDVAIGVEECTPLIGLRSLSSVTLTPVLHDCDVVLCFCDAEQLQEQFLFSRVQCSSVNTSPRLQCLDCVMVHRETDNDADKEPGRVMTNICGSGKGYSEKQITLDSEWQPYYVSMIYKLYNHSMVVADTVRCGNQLYTSQVLYMTVHDEHKLTNDRSDENEGIVEFSVGSPGLRSGTIGGSVASVYTNSDSGVTRIQPVVQACQLVTLSEEVTYNAIDLVLQGPPECSLEPCITLKLDPLIFLTSVVLANNAPAAFHSRTEYVPNKIPPGNDQTNTAHTEEQQVDYLDNMLIRYPTSSAQGSLPDGCHEEKSCEEKVITSSPRQEEDNINVFGYTVAVARSTSTENVETSNAPPEKVTGYETWPGPKKINQQSPCSLEHSRTCRYNIRAMRQPSSSFDSASSDEEIPGEHPAYCARCLYYERQVKKKLKEFSKMVDLMQSGELCVTTEEQKRVHVEPNQELPEEKIEVERSTDDRIVSAVTAVTNLSQDLDDHCDLICDSGLSEQSADIVPVEPGESSEALYEFAERFVEEAILAAISAISQENSSSEADSSDSEEMLGTIKRMGARDVAGPVDRVQVKSVNVACCAGSGPLSDVVHVAYRGGGTSNASACGADMLNSTPEENANKSEHGGPSTKTCTLESAEGNTQGTDRSSSDFMLETIPLIQAVEESSVASYSVMRSGNNRAPKPMCMYRQQIQYSTLDVVEEEEELLEASLQKTSVSNSGEDALVLDPKSIHQNEILNEFPGPLDPSIASLSSSLASEVTSEESYGPHFVDMEMSTVDDPAVDEQVRSYVGDVCTPSDNLASQSDDASCKQEPLQDPVSCGPTDSEDYLHISEDAAFDPLQLDWNLEIEEATAAPEDGKHVSSLNSLDDMGSESDDSYGPSFVNASGNIKTDHKVVVEEPNAKDDELGVDVEYSGCHILPADRNTSIPHTDAVVLVDRTSTRALARRCILDVDVMLNGDVSRSRRQKMVDLDAMLYGSGAVTKATTVCTTQTQETKSDNGEEFDQIDLWYEESEDFLALDAYTATKGAKKRSRGKPAPDMDCMLYGTPDSSSNGKFGKKRCGGGGKCEIMASPCQCYSLERPVARRNRRIIPTILDMLYGHPSTEDTDTHRVITCKPAGSQSRRSDRFKRKHRAGMPLSGRAFQLDLL